MDEARRVLRSFPPASGTFETLKQYDLAIKQHLSALGKLSKEVQAAIAANPAAVLQVGASSVLISATGRTGASDYS